MLTPLDLENVEFGKSFRGYNEEEVDSFLEQVAEDFERIFKENKQLKEEFGHLKQELEHYQTIEETLKNTLIVAEQTAEGVRRNAEKEAELMFRQAKAKAEEIVAASEKEAEEIYRRYREVEEKARNFRVKMESFLHAQLDLIRGVGYDDESDDLEQTKIIAG